MQLPSAGQREDHRAVRRRFRREPASGVSPGLGRVGALGIHRSAHGALGEAGEVPVCGCKLATTGER